MYIIRSRLYPTYIAMHMLPSHSEHTRQRQRHEHTHTRTHNTTHTHDQRAHSTTPPHTQHQHSASRSANITQREGHGKGRGNLKIFSSARGQSTSHIFWVFQKGVANFIFSEFPKGGHTTFHTRLHTAAPIMFLTILLRLGVSAFATAST